MLWVRNKSSRQAHLDDRDLCLLAIQRAPATAKVDGLALLLAFLSPSKLLGISHRGLDPIPPQHLHMNGSDN